MGRWLVWENSIGVHIEHVQVVYASLASGQLLEALR